MNPIVANTYPSFLLDLSEKLNLSPNTTLGIGIVIVAVIVIGIVAWILTKKCKCGSSCSSKACGETSPARSNDGSVEIYVGNLSYDMNEEQFRKEFERFGVVKSARIIGHRTSGKSKGYGFVEMPHRKEATLAIKALNGKDVLGRKLRVNEARNGTRPG